jgi:hypothetical protein
MIPKDPPHHFDTNPKIEQVWIGLLRNTSVAKRFASVQSLSQAIIDLSRRGIRRANPGMDGKELICMIITHQYGAELGKRLRTYLDSRER